MKKKILGLFLIPFVFLLLVTGCGGSKKKEEEPEDKSVAINRVADFEDEIAVVSNVENGKTTYYVVDKDLIVLSSSTKKLTYVDGYAIVVDDEDKKKYNVVDVNQEVVYSYTTSDYLSVTLVSNGCLLTKRKEDKWNSSKIVYGIYSIKDQRFVLEESDTNYSEMVSYGGDMVLLDAEKKKFFNTKTYQTVEFPNPVDIPFASGYATSTIVDQDKNFLLVFLEDGTSKRIEIPYQDDDQKNLEARRSKYTLIQHCDTQDKTTSCNSSVVNLETGEVINLENTYYEITNAVSFTENGYALLVFNNSGGTPYYVVINVEGKQQFEPVRCSSSNKYSSTYDETLPQVLEGKFYDGNYFITVQQDIYKILDFQNTEIIQSSEGERFEGITNGYVRTRYSERGHMDTYYYKNLKGEKMTVMRP